MSKLTEKKSGKLLSVLLAALMIITSVSVSFTAFAAGPVELTSGTGLEVSANAFYTVSSDMTIEGSVSKNGLSIASNVTVIIDIAEGVTLTVKGGAADAGDPGKAGIKMNSGSKLIITGNGTLALIGGNGADGTKGGSSDYANNDTSSGADGGKGGAGGGAGIGTDGGKGGTANGGAGGSNAWPSNASVTIATTVTLDNNTGENGTAGSKGSKGGGNGCGGAGGGGGYGAGGSAIGTGGSGGKGGAKGTDGSKTSGCNPTYSQGSDGNNGSNGSATDVNPSRVFVFSDMDNAINSYVDYYGKSMAALVAIDVDTLISVKGALSEPYEALLTTYGSDVYNYYFGSYDTATLIANLEQAIQMAQNIALALWLQAKTEDVVDYDDTYSNLNTIWSEFDEKYGNFSALSDDTKSFLEDGGYIVIADVEAKLAEYKFAMDVANLRENYYDLITGDVATFSTWDLDWVAEHLEATGTLSAAKTAVSSYVTTLNSLDQNAVNTVFGEGYTADVLQPLLGNLTDLLYASELRDRFSGYKNVYDTAFEPVDLSADDNTLYVVLRNYDSWYTELRGYINELRDFDEDFADKVLNDLDNVMQSKIDSIYTTLNARLTARIDVAYDNYQGFVDVYGYEINTADDVCVQNYRALRQVFNNLNHTQFDFLVDSDNFNVPAETVRRYELIKRALLAFEYYDASRGLSAYEFNDRIPVEDITRIVTENDQVRNKDYTVDREKRETVYNKVKELLESDLVKGLLGDSFDLSSLGDTVNDFIFSDKLVNKLISMIYPIVIDNFAPVWATQLPETYPYSQSGFNFNFQIKRNLNTLREALVKLELYSLPDQLAARPVMDSFPEIKAKLAAVTYDPVYDADQEMVTINPWNDPSLVDEEGNLALEWGVHDKDSLINALTAGLDGVSPIILALLSNKTTNKSVDIKKGTIKDSDSQTFVIIPVTVNVEITEIKLNMSFQGNPGFNNALAPILNVLGAENIGDGNSMTYMRSLATGIATGFDDIINKLSADPIDFILKTLPNLAFALNYGLITPLLGELKEDIQYSATAHYDTDCSAAGNGDITAVDATSININLGEMLDLEEMGIDLESASGLINSIIGLMNKDAEPEEGTEPVEPGEGEGEEESVGIMDLLGLLPLDDLFGDLAYWGDYVEWHKGYRTVTPYYNPDDINDRIPDLPYIEAAPSEVFAHLIDYVLYMLDQDEDLLPALVDALGLDVDLTDEDSLIVAILQKILADPDKAIAAITELMIPVDYSDAFWSYNWKESDFTYNVPALEASDVAYLKYANNWNREKAENIVEGAGDLIDTLLPVLGQEQTLNEMVGGLISGFLGNDTITSLAQALASVGGTFDESTAELLTGVLGIDLGVWGESFGAVLAGEAETGTMGALTATNDGEKITWGFEDGDNAAFFAAVKELIMPFAPVVGILFNKDLTLLDGVIEIKGYDTYANAFSQLFDVLGAEQIADYESLSEQEMLGALIDALAARIDEILSGNLIKNILGVIPNLVYFIESNGVGTALNNILLPINVLLDTIRPIYDVNIKDLIAGLLEDSDISLDLENLTMEQILRMVDESLGTDLTNSTLMTYAIPALYADKKDDKVGDLTSSISEADTLTILLSGIVEAFEAETASGRTNGEIIFEKIGGEEAANLYSRLFTILTGETSVAVEQINWDYMYEDDEIRLDSFTMPEYTESGIINYLSYNNAWNKDIADYIDQNLDAVVNDILETAGQDENFLPGLIRGLLNDNVYTDDIVNKLIDAVNGLLEKVDSSLLSVADLLLDTELANLTLEHVSGITDSATFIDKLATTFAPLDDLLAFVLFGADYRFLHANDGSDLLVLGGGEAYDAALVPILEAVGVDMPAKTEFLGDNGKYDVDTALRTVLTAVAARLDAIAADPVNELFILLPNLIYFINAGGIKAALNNTIAPFEDVISMVTGNESGSILGDVGGVPLNDLTTANILIMIENLTGLEFTDGEKRMLPKFYIGGAEKFDSANSLPAFRMVYPDGGTARRDMITLLAEFLIETLKYKDNLSVFEGILGEEMVTAIRNILSTVKVPMKNIDWLYTEYADTDYTFSGVETSLIFEGYGKLYTQENANYIANHLDGFINDLIQLLGIEIEGEIATSIEDLIEGLVGNSIYTTATAEKVLGYVLTAVDKIEALPASDHIKAVLKYSLDVDLDYYNGFSIVPFEDGDRDAFVGALVDIVRPLYRLLSWLLCDDEIRLFTDSEGLDEIILPGAEGYRFGIGPLLEAIDCRNIPTQDQLNAAEDSEEILVMILNPLFDRLDVVFESPVDEIFEILPNIAYFINSNGLDTSVKNLLNAVYTIIDALEPVLPESFNLDDFITDLIGRPLSTIDMQFILDLLVEKITEGTDIDMKTIVFDAVAEMTTGKIVSYDSMTGFDAYRMIYNGDDTKGDTVTVTLELLLKWIAEEDNAQKLKELIREKTDLPEAGYKYLDTLIDMVASNCSTPEGMDATLHALYYLFYGIETGTSNTAAWQRDYNNRMQFVYYMLSSSSSAGLVSMADFINSIYDNYLIPNGFGNILSPKGFAANGFIALFKQLINFFKLLIEFLKKIMG
ncbi:MAG: hypothetical protein K6G90_08230 [Clostridia bacterium]|nr:hypothetical protein [Clostridia bacterium]